MDWIDQITNWLVTEGNYKWLFSGLGVVLVGWFFKRNRSSKYQRSGDNSTNVQGENVNITVGKSRSDGE